MYAPYYLKLKSFLSRDLQNAHCIIVGPESKININDS